jgi:hypothetical protein
MQIMTSKNFDQNNQQDKLAFDVSGNISNIQSTKENTNRWSRSQVISISIGSILILSIITVTIWSSSRIFADRSQPAIIGSIPQAANVVANYCKALVKHNFSQAQKYILPYSTFPSDLLQQQVSDAEEQNQGPLVSCQIFNGKDATYPGGKQLAIHKESFGYLQNDPAHSYITKEVVSFSMQFFFQKPNAPTTYLTGGCQVVSTGNQQWLIYGSCPMNECPIPDWQHSWGIGPACPPPHIVGQRTNL